MKIKNLVVADIEKIVDYCQVGHMTMSEVHEIPCRILKQDIGGYIDLENNERYSKSQNYVSKRVKEETIIPLTDYYNIFKKPKKNSHQNKEQVYEKVKKLKTQGKI